MVICLERGADDLCLVQLMPLPPRHLCFSKIQSGLSLSFWLTQIFMDKMLLN